MDYFITLNEKSIDAIGEAVEKPITVIEGLKEDIADLEQTVAEKDETIAQKDEESAALEEQISGMHPLIVRPNPLPNIKITNNTSSDIVAYPISIRDADGLLYHDEVTVNASSQRTFSYTRQFVYGTENLWCVALIIKSPVDVNITYSAYGHGFTGVSPFQPSGIFTGEVYRMYVNNANDLSANTLNIVVSPRT